MNDKDSPPSGGINLGDIYFVLFRHKWLIILSALAGMSAAATLLFVVRPPKYQSQTKLLIKYVTESKSPLSRGADENIRSLDGPNSLISTEGLILHSLDLARDVVSEVGAENILAGIGGGADTNKAAVVVMKGLDLAQLNGANVLSISFEHSDAKVVQEVLKQVVVSYYKRHNEMHQPVEISDFQSKETERLRNKLAQINDELRTAKAKAGVVVTEDSQKAYSARI